MKWHSYLQATENIIQEYDGHIPLSIFLKDFFRQHKQMGSRDRKTVASLVYNYYRLGHAWKEVDTNKKIIAGLFLTENINNGLLQFFHPELNEHISLPLDEKINFLSHYFQLFRIADIFPFTNELSDDLDKDAFVQSFLRQPDLFIRVRNNKSTAIIELLKSKNIRFDIINEKCVAFDNGTNIDAIIPDKSWYVVQDFSSQQTAKYFNHSQFAKDNLPLTVWDCCAGSGGKSVLMHDIFPAAKLFVSDIRPSILYNLQHRFRVAEIDNYAVAVLDLTNDVTQQIKDQKFDVIILDVPCSGSGTWARTPEQLYFFDLSQLSFFHDRQIKMMENVMPLLKTGGMLVYITCSVFRKENEEVVNIFKNQQLQLQQTELIKGYSHRADTMFAARFIRI